MPFYEYSCNKCEHKFDKKLSIDDRKIPESEPCPNCNEAECVQQSVGNSNPHTYGLGYEAKNNMGGFKEVLQKIDARSKPLGGKLQY